MKLINYNFALCNLRFITKDPNEDTEWNDILRSKGIIPQKEKEVTEDQIVSLLEQTIEEKQGNSKYTVTYLTLRH